MSTISTGTLKFLAELKSNNNRDWFLANKHRYEGAKDEFQRFISSLLEEIAIFDPGIRHFSARDCIFRIYRDVRFASDKSPYKTHFGAHVTSADRKSDMHSRAGYYIHIGPGESMLAGGAYMPDGKWLKAIRNEIASEPERFKKIIHSVSFKKYFGEMQGEQLKTSPRDFPADHPQIELLRYRSFLAVHPCRDTEVTAPDFLAGATETFLALHPFDRFLNEASEGVS